MPGKKKGKRNSRRGPRRSANATLIRFKARVSTTLSGGAANVPVAPTAGGLNIPKLTTASDAFEKYKFTRLRFRLICDAGSNAADSAVGYVGKTSTTTAVTTLGEIFELNTYSYVTTKQTVHGNWVNVPKSILRGMLPWYQTQGGNGASDVEEDNQGTLYFVGSASLVLTIEMIGTLELAQQADPLNTPLTPSAYQAALTTLEHRKQLTVALREKRDMQARLQLLRLFPQLQSVHKRPTSGFDP